MRDNVKNELPNLSGPDYEEYKRQIKHGSYDYELYHSKSNNDVLGWTTVLTPFVYLFSGQEIPGAICFVILLWLGCAAICYANNWMMDQDPKIIESRKILFKLYLRKKYFNRPMR